MFSRKFNIVGACISRERKKAGLSQEALAEQLHVTRQTISNWESGKSLPDIETLKALAQALNVPIERLIYERQTVQEKQPPDTLLAALSEDFALDIWCRRLGILVLFVGFFYGIRCGHHINEMEHLVYQLSDTLLIWTNSLLWGSALLGISKIIQLLEK